MLSICDAFSLARQPQLTSHTPAAAQLIVRVQILVRSSGKLVAAPALVHFHVVLEVSLQSWHAINSHQPNAAVPMYCDVDI